MRLMLLALAFLLAALPARADPASDANVIEACVAETWPGDVMAACAGIVANPCQAQPGGETTQGIGDCLSREAGALDALLNRLWPELTRRAAETDAANDASAQGLPSAASALVDAQRAWLEFRDAECHYAYSSYGAGTFRTVAHAACFADVTARRAVDFYARLNTEG
jgi:uncharacterized protein YecT (DUF1311 family)